MKIKEYSEKDRENLKLLFAELQAYEKTIWHNRAEPTPEFMDKLTNELLGDVDSRQGKVLIAYDGEIPVGFIAGFVEHDVENDADYFRIDSLIVTQKYRGSGVGKELMKRIEEYARSVGQTKIGLGVLAGNKSAYGYYKKLGFEDYGIEMIKEVQS